MKYSYGKKLQTKEKGGFARLVAMFMTATVLSMGVAGVSSAKEIAGVPVPTAAVCSNVKSLSYKGDPRVSELGFASIAINYSVSPCDKTIPVRVELSLTRNLVGESPIYLDENAALSGKVAIGGVLVNTSYIAKVQVFNANTGEIIESTQIFAAAKTKPV